MIHKDLSCGAGGERGEVRYETGKLFMAKMRRHQQAEDWAGKNVIR